MPGARAHLDDAQGVLAAVDRQIAHHKKHDGKEQGFEHKYLYTAAALTERCARFGVKRVPGAVCADLALSFATRNAGSEFLMADSTDDLMIDTPEGPMTFAAWKKKHPVQIPSRRTKGKDLPVKVKRFTEPK